MIDRVTVANQNLINWIIMNPDGCHKQKELIYQHEKFELTISSDICKAEDSRINRNEISLRFSLRIPYFLIKLAENCVK